MGKIDGMLVQSGGSRAHVAHIMETLSRTFPNVIWKIGGRVDRSTRSGGFSAHSEGRAIDIYLDAADPVDRRLGDILFEMFQLQSAYLKVDHEIWNGQIWSREKGGPRPYTGGNGPHRDHVHVAFVNRGLDDKPLAAGLLCLLAEVQLTGAGGDAADRQDGLYGKAFDPRRPDRRLSRKQRKRALLQNMGMEDAAR